MTGLTAVAAGTAAGPDPAAFTRNSPSFFADPAAWVVTAAVADALASAGEEERAAIGEENGAAAESTGIIVASRPCTATTMGAISRTAGRGLVSPLRFAGANPGVLAGLPCITWRLRGPSLVLAADAVAAVPVAAAVARSWLELGHATYVLVVVHSVSAAGHHARCAVVRAARPGESGGELTALADATERAGGR